jgi:hypothetical protein
MIVNFRFFENIYKTRDINDIDPQFERYVHFNIVESVGRYVPLR